MDIWYNSHVMGKNAFAVLALALLAGILRGQALRGCVREGGAIAGDTAQDLKTGHLLGATPWKQQVGRVSAPCRRGGEGRGCRNAVFGRACRRRRTLRNHSCDLGADLISYLPYVAAQDYRFFCRLGVDFGRLVPLLLAGRA